MKTVLIVDPDPGSGILAEVLQRRGCRGIAVPNAGDALVIVRGGQPVDLVVTELQLPDMEGLDFLLALKAVAPHLPIIVVTSSGSIESYLHAVNLGVYEYLNKPVSPKELVRIASPALAGPGTAPAPREALRSARPVSDMAGWFRGSASKAADR
jgi:DNA-binding NtrC family response regulator